ncbi:helix-turn-helix domain-containing protein [Roseibium sp.]|uniref:helix-turn-helix domain-containing protein n=1 Tax=Roseibium sp. TaxID=1936156 RepID=UPI003B5188E5
MAIETCVLRDSEEIEAFFLEMTGMKPGFFQLSAGVIDLSLETVDLGGVTLIWTRSKGRQRWKDHMAGDGLHLGIAVESDGSIQFRGSDVSKAEVAVWHPGVEMDFVMQGPLISLDIGIESWLVEELGWSVNRLPIAATTTESLEKLLHYCSECSRILERLDTASPAKPFKTAMRDQVLDLLEPILVPWTSSDAASQTSSISKDYRIITRAEDLFHELSDPAQLEIGILCRELGVSRRTLFRAFRQTLGVGPRRYFELRRLYQLRSTLKAACSDETTVTAIANDSGFTELGRLAGLYKRHFGETPIETLKSSYPH